MKKELEEEFIPIPRFAYIQEDKSGKSKEEGQKGGKRKKKKEEEGEEEEGARVEGLMPSNERKLP
jgi:hypothetical protein